MNSTANKFLLPGGNFMPEMHLRQPGFTYNACGHSQKSEKEYQNSKKKDTPGISTRMNETRSVFSTMWHIKISKIYQEEWHLTKYCVIRHLKFLVIQIIMDVNAESHQWSTSF